MKMIKNAVKSGFIYMIPVIAIVILFVIKAFMFAMENKRFLGY